MRKPRKYLSELSPAHVRVLDLLVRQPERGLRTWKNGAPRTVDYAWLSARTHWDEGTVRALLCQARKHFGVDTTLALLIKWRTR